jgi:hypothetical protein
MLSRRAGNATAQYPASPPFLPAPPSRLKPLASYSVPRSRPGRQVRKREMDLVWKNSMWGIVSMFLWAGTPMLVTLVTFFVYTWSGQVPRRPPCLPSFRLRPKADRKARSRKPIGMRTMYLFGPIHQPPVRTVVPFPATHTTPQPSAPLPAPPEAAFSAPCSPPPHPRMHRRCRRSCGPT